MGSDIGVMHVEHYSGPKLGVAVDNFSPPSTYMREAKYCRIVASCEVRLEQVDENVGREDVRHTTTHT